MPLIDDIKDQHKLVKGKGFKYKVSYFLEYYKWATIAVIIAGVCLFLFIKAIVTHRDDMFNAAFVNAINAPDSEVFAEYIGIDTKQYQATFDTSYTIYGNGAEGQTSYLSFQKIVAVIAARTLDAMIGDSATLKYLAPNGYFGDLRDFFDEETLIQNSAQIYCIKYSENEDEGLDDTTSVIKKGYNPEDADFVPILIDVSDSQLLKDCISFPNDACVGAIANTTHPEYFEKFYDYLYDESIRKEATTVVNGFIK